jgi:hypothetical protein
MVWALVSSAYVIFLYRKLKAEAEAGTLPAAGTGQPATVDATFDALDRRLSALEARLAILGDKAAVR